MYACKLQEFDLKNRINYLKLKIVRDIRIQALSGNMEAAWLLRHL